MCSQLLPDSVWTSLSKVSVHSLPRLLLHNTDLQCLSCPCCPRRRIRRKQQTREVAVYMENIHSASSPGVRVYMDNDPQARIIEPTKGPTAGRREDGKDTRTTGKAGLRKAGPEEKISPRIDHRDSDSVTIRPVTAVLTPRHPLTHQPVLQKARAKGQQENDVSHSTTVTPPVISSQSFAVSMSRAEKYVFLVFLFPVVVVVLSLVRRPSRPSPPLSSVV